MVQSLIIYTFYRTIKSYIIISYPCKIVHWKMNQAWLCNALLTKRWTEIHRIYLQLTRTEIHNRIMLQMCYNSEQF